MEPCYRTEPISSSAFARIELHAWAQAEPPVGGVNCSSQPSEPNMELLLNLIWITLALAALCAFARRRSSSPQVPGSRWIKALLALTCSIVLLFPIISASDDLHPVQAAVEDASKRVQLALASGSADRSAAPTAAILFFVAFAMYLSFASPASWRRCEQRVAVRVLHGERTSAPGRGPPRIL
jgi:hypothetical protein